MLYLLERVTFLISIIKIASLYYLFIFLSLSFLFSFFFLSYLIFYLNRIYNNRENCRPKFQFEIYLRIIIIIINKLNFYLYMRIIYIF